MKKILFFISFLVALSTPTFLFASGSITIGLGCNAHYAWASGSTNSCRLNGVPVNPTDTSLPQSSGSPTTNSSGITCSNSGQTAADSASVTWADLGWANYNPANPQGNATTSNCVAPTANQNYSCGAGGSACAACGGTNQPACAGSTYTSSTCNNVCAVATPKYSCSGSSCVRDDVNGFTTDSACNNSCVTTAKYYCGGSGCVRDDVNGITTSSTCNNSCTTGQATCSLSAVPSPGASSSPITLNWTYNKNSGAARNDMYCQFSSPQNINYFPKTANFSTVSDPTVTGATTTQALRLGSNVFNATCDTYGGSDALDRAQCATTVTGNSISVCGNGIPESGEQCDNGAANGTSWPASCSTSCTTITGSAGSSIIGFTSSYAPTLTIAQGSNTTLNWTTAGMVTGSCTVERSDTAGPSSWYTSSINPVAETNGSYTLNGWASRALPYYFRLKCTKSPSGTIYSNTATLTVTAPTVAACGDGIIGNTAGEECDDGNTTNGDGCSSLCKTESVCGNNICESSKGETCSSCSSDCGVCVDNSACSADFTITPSHVLVGKPFTGSVTVRNIGTTDWTVGTYSFKSIDVTNWGITKVDLPGQINGLPTVGSNKFVMNATAPATPGNYSFSWKMQKTATTFGDTCTPPGGITVYKAQCDDGLDNEGIPDSKIDCADPQCLNQSGVCNKECDDETNGCGATQSLIATPPLVRNGASATLNWSIANYVGNCTLVGPGLNLTIDPAAKATNTVINNITEKRTYYLTCGGLRSAATISVIKFVEARPGDINSGANTPVNTTMYSCSGGKTGTECVEDPFGEYSSADCDGMCAVVPPCGDGEICSPNGK